MIVVDAHKRTHTLAAADELGRELAAKTLAATPDGHLTAIAWAGAGQPAVGIGGLPASERVLALRV